MPDGKQPTDPQPKPISALVVAVLYMLGLLAFFAVFAYSFYYGYVRNGTLLLFLLIFFAFISASQKLVAFSRIKKQFSLSSLLGFVTLSSIYLASFVPLLRSPHISPSSYLTLILYGTVLTSLISRYIWSKKPKAGWRYVKHEVDYRVPIRVDWIPHLKVAIGYAVVAFLAYPFLSYNSIANDIAGGLLLGSLLSTHWNLLQRTSIEFHPDGVGLHLWRSSYKDMRFRLVEWNDEVRLVGKLKYEQPTDPKISQWPIVPAEHVEEVRAILETKQAATDTKAE